MAGKVCERDSQRETEGNFTGVYLNAWLSRGHIVNNKVSRGDIHYDIKKLHLSDIQVSGHLAPKWVAPNC